MQLASPLSTCDTTARHFQDILLEMQYWYVQEKKNGQSICHFKKSKIFKNTVM